MSPLAGPLALSGTLQDARNGRRSGALAPTKDLRPRSRLSPRQIATLAQQLSDRDQDVLRLVSRFKVMSGEQLRRLFWSEGTPATSARLARRGLARLVALDVLEPLARLVGGVRAGSAGTTYAVGCAGQYLLRSGQQSAKRVRRAYTPGERYLAHTLAVAQLYVDLVEAGRWGLCEVLGFQPEPECWRTYPGMFGAPMTLKPDAAARLGIGDYEYWWLIEADMATEAQPTIEGKARRYHDYYRTGISQRESGTFPRVAWITPDAARAESVAETLRRLPATAQRLFAVTTTSEAIALLTAGERS